MDEKIAGILGGMGPEATVDLMRRIIAATDVRDDMDHVRCIVDNNPKVPSRIRALIEKTGISPASCMADMARRLEAWGADFLCIACNTAHNYYEEVRKAVGIPVLDMIELTARAAASAAPGGTAGILASPAVRLTGLYEGPCADQGLKVVYADSAHEGRLLQIIRDIKAGHAAGPMRAAFVETVEHVRQQGADVLVIACTELGIIGAPGGNVLVDAADVLARAVVDTAKGRNPLPAA